MAKVRPETLDPAVRFILAHAPTYKEQYALEVAADLGADTIRRWQYEGGSNPHIRTIRKALRALRFKLVVVPMGEDE